MQNAQFKHNHHIETITPASPNRLVFPLATQAQMLGVASKKDKKQPCGASRLKTANEKHMKTNIKPTETRFPRLTRAILRRLDRDQLRDVAEHGADAGWPGFAYYSDTAAFFKAHKADILQLAQDMASELGQDIIEMVQGFRCLGHQARFTGAWANDYSASEIAEALYSGRGENAELIRNAMAWFALEEIARELNPDL